jgi:hypothetical protein
MLKNKKGSLFLGLGFGLFLFITGVLIMPFILDDVSTTRVDLDCYGEGLTGGNKITCLFVGLLNPYYIWFFTAMALGLIVGAGR